MDFFQKEFGIAAIPSKAIFVQILSRIDGKEIGQAMLTVLRNWFETVGEVITVDGKAMQHIETRQIPQRFTNIERLCDQQRCYSGSRSDPPKDK